MDAKKIKSKNRNAVQYSLKVKKWPRDMKKLLKKKSPKKNRLLFLFLANTNKKKAPYKLINPNENKAIILIITIR